MTGPARTVQEYWTRQLDLMWSLPAAVVAREPDSIHDLRAAGRRLRSTIRVFEPLLRRTPSAHLAAELNWYNGVLGAARDAEVIAEQLSILPDFGRRREILARLVDQMLASRRAGRLLDDLDGFIGSAWRGAVRPGEDLLLVRLDRAERRVADAWRSVLAGPDDLAAAEHRLRRRAKTARYALEALGGTVDESGDRAAGYAGLAALLGVMQDAVVIRHALGPDVPEAAEALLAGQDVRARRAREGLPAAVREALPESLNRQFRVAE